jgi:hypothetical protein
VCEPITWSTITTTEYFVCKYFCFAKNFSSALYRGGGGRNGAGPTEKRNIDFHNGLNGKQMMRYYGGLAAAALAVVLLGPAACSKKAKQEEASIAMPFKHMAADSLRAETARFAPVDITYDESILSPSEKEALAKLVRFSHDRRDFLRRCGMETSRCATGQAGRSNSG